MTNFTITGPDTDIGLRGPSSNPVHNTGTLRLAPQGESRKLMCDLIIDLDDDEQPFRYEPPLNSLVTFTAYDEKGDIAAGPFSLRGPEKQVELTSGQTLFEAHRYGIVGYPFPSSLTPAGQPKTFTFRWQIDEAVGQGMKELLVGIDGEDIWIKDFIEWLP